MSAGLNDVYVDIPYITEDPNSDERKEVTLCQAESSVVVPWYTAENRNHSDSPSPSSSFRDDGALLKRKHTVPFVFVSGQPYRTSSLNDIRGRTDYCVCPTITRQGSGRRSQYSEYSPRSSSRRKSATSDRRSSVRSSVKSNRSRKSSYGLERSRSIRSSYSRRVSTIVSTPPIRKTEEDLKREKRHRIAVWLVLGSFIFIAISSILVVIITLTHQSEHNSKDNTTRVYYTFARPSNLP